VAPDPQQTIGSLLRTIEELRKTNAFLETLLFHGPSIVFKLDGRDPSTRSMTYLSSNIERILGYAPDEARAVPGFWEAHVHPDDREAFREITAAALRERKTRFEQELRIRHKDGSYRWMHTVFLVDYDHDGTAASILGYDSDVTERRTAEEAAKQARLEADRANRAKSEFLSRISHELRTPLNAILGFAQVLEMDSLSAEQRDSLGYILKGGRHLLALINEVLDIVRIESGRFAISLEPVSLQHVMRETLDLMGPVAVEGGAVLAGGADGARARYVRADNGRLKQILLNLVSNGIKYGGRGVAVTLSCEDVADSRVRIRVTDSGPGIPADKVARLFVPFDRLGSERAGIEGTGLGLALSRSLAQAMGGTLGVETAAGRGSSFWVELPVAEEPIKQLHIDGHGTTEVPAPDSVPESFTVLYIEDNLSNLELVKQILNRRPEVKLLSAMQGRLGLDLARKHRPNLILLDLHLPDVAGDEVLRHLQAMAETRAIPVIMITADATAGQADRLLRAGARAYLTKPLDVKQFLTLLQQQLTGSEAHGGEAAPRDRRG
jgi:PAS domain S-box-containing protein